MADLFLGSTRPLKMYLGATEVLRLYAGSVLVWPLPASVVASTVWFTGATTATGGGNVTNDGGSTVTARGLCWAVGTTMPTILNSPYTTDGSGTGVFTSSLTGLSANTWYTVRAYATNNAGTTYSDHVVYHSTLEVGQYYQGGIVYYINGNNGLIMSSYLGTAVFGCKGTYLGAGQTARGYGQANTNLILANCATSGIAARLCDSLTENGYSDWYLGTADEMQYMMNNLLYSYSADDYNGYLWTSSEGNDYANEAHYVHQNMGSAAQKDSVYRVRATRSF